jgi:cytochrome b561
VAPAATARFAGGRNLNLQRDIVSLSPRYTHTAIAFHWLIAVALGGAVSFGFYVHGLHMSPSRIRLVNWHKWIGVTLFLLVSLRLLWRITHPAPPLPSAMHPLVRLGANLSHIGLYVLMLAIPVTGWLMSSAKGFRTVWFGLVPLPNLVGRDAQLGIQLLELHETLNWLLIALVALHVAAALKHHFLDRDDVLLRMLPAHTKQ